MLDLVKLATLLTSLKYSSKLLHVSFEPVRFLASKAAIQSSRAVFACNER